jgi:hypothetical protein
MEEDTLHRFPRGDSLRGCYLSIVLVGFPAGESGFFALFFERFPAPPREGGNTIILDPGELN